jgi:hypothetical protein
MIRADDIIEQMIEVLPVDEVNGFRKIKETLTQMGVASRNENFEPIGSYLTQERKVLYLSF